MSQLSETKLQVCHKDSATVSTDEAITLMEQLPEWRLEKVNDIQQLNKQYRFKNFVDGLAFSNKVADLAEQENHHPALLIEWGKVKVTWWTHLIKGVHTNDFIMAARCDDLYNEPKDPT